MWAPSRSRRRAHPRAPALVAFLAERDVAVTEASGDLAAAVRERRLPVGLRIRADYPAKFEGSRPAPVELLHDTTWTESARRSAHVRAVLNDYARSVNDTRLVLRGVAPAAVQALRIHDRDFATAGDRAARALATLPIFVLLAAFIGGLGIAADVAAGERERGSLESLLLHPVGGLSIVGGKWLAVALVAMATVVLALLTTVAVMQHPRVQQIDLPIGLSAADTALVLVLLVPLAMFAAAVQLWIAFQAKTYKEAQTKLSTLIFLPMIPGFLFAFGSIEPAPWMTFTPMIGQHVMLTALVRGDTPATIDLAALSVITLVAGAVACVAAARQLGRESILRRTQRVTTPGSRESRDDRCVRMLSEHDGAIRRLSASYERDPSRRQDLVQDIWLAVWQALPRFRDECSERTFVFRIAHNRAVSHIEHWQRRRTDPLDDDAPIAASGPDPEHTLSQQQRRERLQAAVQELPLGLRQVVVLTLEGLSNAEVADIVGISENNVAVRMTRARAELTRLLGAGERQRRHG